MKLYKTKPYKHQLKVLKRSRDKVAFALLMEQGTGKSKVVVDTAAHLRRQNKIDMLVIIAPKGVAPAWIRQQLPEHMPDDIKYSAALWRSDLSQTAKRHIQQVLDAPPEILRIIVMNIEAFGMTQSAIDFAISVLDAAQSALLVVDESHRIKTPGAHTTKRILNLRIRSAYRRILTGTVGDKPFDLFSQFGFLDPEILGVDSFTAFKAEYAELLNERSGLMRHITMRVPKTWKGQYIDDDSDTPQDTPRNADGTLRKKLMVPIYMPTIVATNADGSPKYKNLDQLQKLIAPHSYRVLKRDCLDLPPKLYNRYYTQLTTQQEKLYQQVQENLRIEWEDERITTFNKLTALLRLQQIVCGYVPDGNDMHEIFPNWKKNPRIMDTLELIGDRPDGEGTIIWCRFIEDIKRVSEALRDSYGEKSVVQYYGKVNDKDRLDAVARFQGERQIMDRKGNFLRNEPIAEKDRARFMVSQQRAGGVGQTWTAANLSLHYSNTFSLIDRLQAEDRPHRIGQERPVQYIDVEAEDTVDGVIINALIAKHEVADVINADPATEWLAKR